ncbi:hypothetical protein HKD37_07G018750 [Glycine soja]
MATPPSSPPILPESVAPSPSTSKKIEKVARLRSLATRPVGAENPMFHVDPVTGKVDVPHRKKLRIYLGIIYRDKVGVTIDNWKQDVQNSLFYFYNFNKPFWKWKRFFSTSMLNHPKKMFFTVPKSPRYALQLFSNEHNNAPKGNIDNQIRRLLVEPLHA